MVGGYRLVRRLGSGERAEIWLGHAGPTLDGAESSVAAVKIFRPTTEAASISREIEALTRSVSIDHVVQLTDLATGYNGRPVLIFRRLGATTASALLAERQGLSAGEAVTLIAPIATAVAHLHRLGVAHGNISLGAVRFDDYGAPVLCGFGGATIVGPLPALSHSSLPPVLLGACPEIRHDAASLVALTRAVVETTPETLARADILSGLDEFEVGSLLPDGFCEDLADRIFALAPACPVLFPGMDVPLTGRSPGVSRINLFDGDTQGVDGSRFHDGGTRNVLSRATTHYSGAALPQRFLQSRHSRRRNSYGLPPHNRHLHDRHLHDRHSGDRYLRDEHRDDQHLEVRRSARRNSSVRAGQRAIDPRTSQFHQRLEFARVRERLTASVSFALADGVRALRGMLPDWVEDFGRRGQVSVGRRAPAAVISALGGAVGTPAGTREGTTATVTARALEHGSISGWRRRHQRPIVLALGAFSALLVTALLLVPAAGGSATPEEATQRQRLVTAENDAVAGKRPDASAGTAPGLPPSASAGSADGALVSPEPRAFAGAAPSPPNSRLAELIAGDDPIAAATALLQLRHGCLQRTSFPCLVRIDQPGSAAEDSDARLIRELKEGRNVTALKEFGGVAPTLIQRLGNSALLSLSPVTAASSTHPASLLLVKGTNGWLIRDLVPAG